MERWVKHLAYPVVMVAGIVLYVGLIDLGWSMQAAVFATLILAAGVIHLLEFKFPHRNEWNPGAGDLINDSVFMILVQVLLPRFLSYLLTIFILGKLASLEMTLKGLWPHTWPVTLQVVLMVLTADFFRYWLHYWSHNWVLLWQLHSVHHSPPRLYWLNVGRFHPLEKALQFVFDTLPFVVLGVHEEVVTLYFVFYAMNGFFQHCNIQLRLGFLNWIISGPELHRWHHSRLTRESNNNYGNNLIVWDTLFGTRFLPEDRCVEELGLINRKFPQDFLRQMKTPFIKGLDKRED